MSALPIVEPSTEAKAMIDALRFDLIGEAADAAIPFLIGVREAARDGDLDRLERCLKAVWFATGTMRQAFHALDRREASPS